MDRLQLFVDLDLDWWSGQWACYGLYHLKMGERRYWLCPIEFGWIDGHKDTEKMCEHIVESVMYELTEGEAREWLLDHAGREAELNLGSYYLCLFVLPKPRSQYAAEQGS